MICDSVKTQGACRLLTCFDVIVVFLQQVASLTCKALDLWVVCSLSQDVQLLVQAFQLLPQAVELNTKLRRLISLHNTLSVSQSSVTLTKDIMSGMPIEHMNMGRVCLNTFRLLYSPPSPAGLL